MGYLSVAEASKRYSIPENNLRYWLDNKAIASSMEVRGKRTVRVVLEADLEGFLASRTQTQQEHQQEDQTRGSTRAEEAFQRFALSLTHLQTQLDTRSQEIGNLQFELGEATGKLHEMELRLEMAERLLNEKDARLLEKDSLIAEKASEITEWRREIAAAKEESSKPRWRWPWQK